MEICKNCGKTLSERQKELAVTEYRYIENGWKMFEDKDTTPSELESEWREKGGE